MSDRSFIALGHLGVAPPRISDRTADLKSVIILNGDDRDFDFHLTDPALARQWAEAFTKAAELLEAAGPDRFCPKCGTELPGHGEGCPLGGAA
jgi:NADH pyrophosphatase NudC (nudix superfamily)